jgi:hypothetical protein
VSVVEILSLFVLANFPQADQVLNIVVIFKEIMDVEHLWHYNEMELNKLNTEGHLGKEGGSGAVHNLSNHPLLAGTALAGSTDTNPDFVANLCNIADRRLYKIVKWCKSLPLFKNISVRSQTVTARRPVQRKSIVPVSDRRPNLSADKLVVRAVAVLVLLQVDVHPGGNQGVPGEEHNVESSPGHGHASVHRENVEFHRTVEEVAGRSVRVRRDEGYRFAHFR